MGLRRTGKNFSNLPGTETAMKLSKKPYWETFGKDAYSFNVTRLTGDSISPGLNSKFILSANLKNCIQIKL